MTDPKNTPNQDTPREDWKDIQAVFDKSTSPDTEPLESLLEHFRSDLQHHPYVRAKTHHPTLSPPLWLIWTKRLLAPATTLAVIVIGLSFLGQPTPTWGQVVAKFQDMTFFSASIYSKENGLSKPDHIELWMGQGGKARMRLGSQLIFAEKGEILAAFDLKTRKQTDPNQVGKALIQVLGSGETFSMDTILQGIAQGSPMDRTPVLNENAMISDDLAVFDLASQEHAMWFRIWALKKTGLPIRIRMWDPSNAESMEVLFDYSKPQSERFFDPKAFGAVLGTVQTGQLNLAYLYLEDAGGKLYAPGITNQDEAMKIVTTTIDGTSFSLSHYADKMLVLYFWDRVIAQRDWAWITQKHDQYKDRQDVQFVIVSLDKNTSRVKQNIALHKIDFTVLHEPGKGLANSLVRALGIKHEQTFFLLRKGQACAMQPVPKLNDEILSLACQGLTLENSRWLNQYVKMFETTQDQMQDLCGAPHDTETLGSTTLWHYHFVSSDNIRKQSMTIRFNDKGQYTGVAVSNRLVHPSKVSIQFGRTFWDTRVVPGLGLQTLSEDKKNPYVEIAFEQGSSYSVIGGGHPRKNIVPEQRYDREIAEGQYQLRLQLIQGDRYQILQKLDLMNELSIGPNEQVDMIFSETNIPQITRSPYDQDARDMASETRQGLLQQPDHKQRILQGTQETPTYDDPKYLPWQLHLKQIADRYKDRPLPDTMELLPKGTDETYALTMFPKNLPGFDGTSAVSLEGSLKKRFASHPLGPGIMRWLDHTPDTTLNHDLVYRDTISDYKKHVFILESLGYQIEKKVEDRTVYVATYDGRTLPAPDQVSAPDPVGWGYFSASDLIDILTRGHNQDTLAAGPLFIDETNLPSKPAPGQTHKDIAVSMEMPGSYRDLETLRPWFADTFGITFKKDTRPMEILIIKKRE